MSSKSSSFSPKKSDFEEPLELREKEILLKDVGEMKQFENDSVSMNNTTDNDGKGMILFNSVRNKNNFIINHRNLSHKIFLISVLGVVFDINQISLLLKFAKGLNGRLFCDVIEGYRKK